MVKTHVTRFAFATKSSLPSLILYPVSLPSWASFNSSFHSVFIQGKTAYLHLFLITFQQLHWHFPTLFFPLSPIEAMMQNWSFLSFPSLFFPFFFSFLFSLNLQVFIKLSNPLNKRSQVIHKPMVTGYHKTRNMINKIVHTWIQKNKKVKVNQWRGIKSSNRHRYKKNITPNKNVILNH